jgi:hypothetical protein
MRYRAGGVGYQNVQMHKIMDGYREVRKVIVSDDNQYWAAYCTNGYIVYIGKLTDPPS